MATTRWKAVGTAILFAALSFAHIGMARAVNVGDKAPAFTLSASTGKDIRLSDFAGKKTVVLFFYIGAFTNA